MLSLTKKLWSLSKRQRLFVVLCVGVYLVVFQPWSEASHSVAANVYAGAAAMLVLAVLPRSIRLLYAVGLALLIAVVVLALGPAVFRVQV